MGVQIRKIMGRLFKINFAIVALCFSLFFSSFPTFCFSQTKSIVAPSVQGKVERIREFVGEKGDKIRDFVGVTWDYGSLTYYLTIFFYLMLVIFLIILLLELPVKISRRIIKKPYVEHPAKKVSRVALMGGLWAKFFCFIMLTLVTFSRAKSLPKTLKPYIENPKSLLTLVKTDKVFLTIFVLLVVYEIIKMKRRARGKA